jgi:release factor glutamine methyltransferase
MPTEAVWTIKKLLDWTTDYFTKAKIENPHLEAEILLAHTLQIKRIDLYIRFEQVLTKDELARFKGCILRRKDHEPTAYITGIRSFMSLDLNVTKDVLIPRPETEILVESAIDIAKTLENPKILDIGTGSGAIAVSLAKYLPASYIYVTDISEKAIEAAELNAKKHGVQDRIKLEVADLFPKEALTFDLIVSNPPYIKTADIDGLAPEIRDFEPRMAYDGGEDGLKYYKTIIGKAGGYLMSGGQLLLEIDPGLLEAISKMAQENGFGNFKIKKDLNGLERVVVIS